MAVIVIDKDSDSITVTTDGVPSARTVTREDTIVSTPGTGYKKVLSIKWDAVNEKMIFSVEE